MRILFLFIILAFISAAPAHAQDNKIRVIGEDGTVQEVTIPAPRPVPAAPKKLPEINVRPKGIKTTPDAAAEPLVETRRTPPPAPAAPEPRWEPESKIDRPEIAEEDLLAASAETIEFSWPPTPRRKPPLPKYLSNTLYESPVQRNIQQGDLLSIDAATHIALENAPPAQDYKMSPEWIDGNPVFRFDFKTDNGPVEVLVDAYSGKIVKR